MTKIRTAAAAAIFLFSTAARSEDKKPAAPAAVPAKAPAAPAASAAAPAKTPAAAPAAAAPSGPPTPSKELEAFMKAFEGTWKCESTFVVGAFGPGTPELKAKSTVKFKKDYNGFVYRGEFEVKKQKGIEIPMKGTMGFVWDAGGQQILSSMIDSMGSLGTASGKPEGDTVVLVGEGHAMGMTLKTRQTMAKKSDKEIFHKEEVDMGKGWMPMFEETCKK